MAYQESPKIRTSLQVARFDPTPHDFPQPSVPVLPQPRQLWHGGKAGVNTDPAHYRSYSRGRYALFEAYRLAGLDSSSTILAPAYHCITMLDPAISLNANILLYPLLPDLSPDMRRLDDLANTSPFPIKVLLATHFFGLAKDFSDLKSWCDLRSIVLVEDCSHVLFTEDYRSPGTGAFGEYVTASPYKFFPSEDGGLLYAREAQKLNGVSTQRPGFVNELRGLKRLFQKGRARQEVSFDTEVIDSRLAEISISQPPAPSTRTRVYDRPSPMFQSSEVEKSALISSRYLTRRLSASHIAQQRKNRYRRWLEAVDELPGCRALYPDWPETCAPYMFPLYIDDPDPRFFWLKKLGVPIWRWDEMAQSGCLVSQKYQYRLLHLPCHQSLDEEQMAWMLYVIRKVMRHPARSSF